MKERFTRIFITVYAAALVLFTVYAALDIYGTTSGLTTVYPVAGGMLLAAGAVLLTYSGLCYNKRNHSYHETG